MRIFCLLVALFSFGLFARAQDSTRKNTSQELEFMNSIMDTLNCKCMSCGGFADVPKNHTDSGGANLTFYRMNGTVSMLGCFVNNEMRCGINCVYDANGKLDYVTIHRDFHKIGEAKMPE